MSPVITIYPSIIVLPETGRNEYCGIRKSQTEHEVLTAIFV
jgi:hypothetical protein